MIKSEPKDEIPLPELIKIEPLSNDTGIETTAESESLDPEVEKQGLDSYKESYKEYSNSYSENGIFDDRFDPLTNEDEPDSLCDEIETPSPSKVREVRVRVKERAEN